MTSFLRRTVDLLPRTGSDPTGDLAAVLEALPTGTQQALALLDDSPEGTPEWAFAMLPSGSRAVLEMFGAAEFDDAAHERDLQPARITDFGRAVIHACAERHDGAGASSSSFSDSSTSSTP